MKQKQPKLSKEELIQRAKAIAEAEKGKKIVREVLFPILQEHATTIQNAERLTEIFKVVIMQAMQIPFKDKTVGDLDFESMLADEKEDKSKATFIAFTKGFKDVPIADAVKILQEFSGGISAVVEQEMKKREFKTITLEDLIGK